ncbi:alpha-galactosidase [Flavobacterium sp. CF108]|uniref:alpha-galactosidase n=1 Tax=unclassified Flavobacterium TaxID=196869 RepID=UPI0008CEF1BA|nr:MULTISPECIES: alpha-galactosidase [unclassified Flavobacterium]SEO21798.1 alpha-galactosidase [Flavobacterium sp. fv08]SHG51226.1 alpha-galactosidase [Flavobacterium sp. CF108]
MKRFLLLLTIMYLPVQAQESSIIKIETEASALVLKVGKNKKLYQTYLGTKLNNSAEYEAVSKENTKNFVVNDGNPLIDLRHSAYPTFGTDNLFEPAIRITHNDGNPSLELEYQNHTIQKIDNNTAEIIIKLKDPEYPVFVNLHYKTFYKENVIESWTEIQHNEKKPVMLYNYASSALHLDADQYWLTQFYSDVVEEMRMEESQLTRGIKVIDSKLGVRTNMFAPPSFFLSLNSKSGENTGEVIAGTIAWSGNFKYTFDIDNNNELRIISGINEFASEYNLEPGKTFKTPVFIYTFSNQGKGQASRNLHAWARKYGLKDGEKPRLTLLNNWETTFFDFDENKLANMFTDAKTLGVDMFLLDDGWFGNKYPRSGSTSGLGDWQATKSKLPNGIGFLMEQAQKTNVKFGIWIEPEMINEKTELYEKHPDWVLSLPNREKSIYRTQLVLDLCNPQVQDFVFKVVDDIMQTKSGVAFFKWDCNRMMTSAYSTYLKNQQSHLFIEYTKGLYKVLDRIKAKYPNLPMMLCAGGGGRVDYGMLNYFTEFWASDNTDPFDRVFIQWGYSNFYPALATCNHVTSMGNQSVKFKTDVAMMGKLGFDIQVGGLKPNELQFCQQAVSNYKRLSPVIWQGDLYRLISPYEESRAVLMYVNQDKTKSVVFSYTLHPLADPNYSLVRLEGLDPLKKYKVEEINIMPEAKNTFEVSGNVFSGDFLMKAGVKVSSSRQESSIVLEITAVD